MNTTRQRDLHAIATWLGDLATLTAGTIPLPDAKTKCAALATALVEDYPPAAFTRPSLLAVARECKFFPSYGEICTHLSAWWRDNRPIRPAIAGPETHRHTPTPPRTDHGTTNGLASLRTILTGERHEPTHDEHAHVTASAARAIDAMNQDFDALYRRDKPAAPTPYHLTREQLNAEYAKAGTTGPKVNP